MEQLIIDYWIELLLGIISGGLGVFIRVLFIQCKAIRLGMQATLRNEMIKDYNHYVVEKKYAPIYAKENFDNMHEQYAALGANGVMDGMYEEFMDLPTQLQEADVSQ